MAKRLEVTWSGLDAFQAELAILTANLVDESNAILRASAEAAKAEIAAAYPFVLGGLKAGLRLTATRGRVLAGATLRQRAPHGHLYEFGTKPRYNKAGAFRGLSQPHPTFVPIARAHRRAAIAAIIARLQAHGATQVTGDVDAA